MITDQSTLIRNVILFGRETGAHGLRFTSRAAVLVVFDKSRGVIKRLLYPICYASILLVVDSRPYLNYASPLCILRLALES